MADLGPTIEEAAANPARIQGDAGSVDERSIGELIQADRYLASKAATKKNQRGLLIQKIEPGGTL